MIETLKKLLPFYDKLSEKDQKLLNERSYTKEYEKDEIIFGMSFDCLGMVIVLEGEIRTYMLSPEGREVTLFKTKANDYCVLTASCVIKQITFETLAKVEKKCKAIIIPADVLKIIKENIYASNFLYKLATKRFSEVMDSMQQLLFSSLLERLAKFLVKEAYANKSKTINMTHEEIARQISSSREVVARSLKDLEDEGVIELKRKQIIIKNLELLKNIY